MICRSCCSDSKGIDPLAGPLLPQNQFSHSEQFLQPLHLVMLHCDEDMSDKKGLVIKGEITGEEVKSRLSIPDVHESYSGNILLSRVAGAAHF